MEKIPDTARESFEAGQLVRLKEGTEPSDVKNVREIAGPGPHYRILHITHHEDGPNVAWIGPIDVGERYAGRFEPREEAPVGPEKSVTPIAVTHLERILS